MLSRPHLCSLWTPVLNISTSVQLAASMPSGFQPAQTPDPAAPVAYFPYFDRTYLGVAASLNGGNVLGTFVHMLVQWMEDLGKTRTTRCYVFCLSFPFCMLLSWSFMCYFCVQVQVSDRAGSQHIPYCLWSLSLWLPFLPILFSVAGGWWQVAGSRRQVTFPLSGLCNIPWVLLTPMVLLSLPESPCDPCI